MSDARKRSIVRQTSKSPRFTAIDFYIPPGGPFIDVPIRGRAVQVVGILDFNASGPDLHTTPPYDVVQDTVLNELGDYADAGPVVGNTLNLAGDQANTVAPFGGFTFTINLAAATPAGVLTITAPFTVAGVAQPSATPVICTLPPGAYPFAGGGPGPVVVQIDVAPGLIFDVAPAVPGDLTVDIAGPAVGLNAPCYITYANGIIEHFPEVVTVTSFGNPLLLAGVTTPRAGYVHLNRVTPHIPVPPIGFPGMAAFQTEQAVPIPTAPVLIRVEQEFDWLRIESASTIAVPFPCVGIVIVEHETEQEVVPV